MLFGSRGENIMANNENNLKKIPLLKTVAGMSAMSYIALLLLFVVAIAIVTTEMIGI